jgi:hypothetical protein
MNSLLTSTTESIDGFSYTFENSLSYSESCSEDSDLEEERVPGTIKTSSRLWKIGTLWVHEIS